MNFSQTTVSAIVIIMPMTLYSSAMIIASQLMGYSNDNGNMLSDLLTNKEGDYYY